MRILVIGSGGREHAIVRALLTDSSVTEVHAAPGNPGIEDDGVRLHAVDLANPKNIADLAQELAVDLVVIGPEVPLILGAVDELRGRGIPAFGPSQAAAQIEGSKAFAKDVMAVAGVATGKAISCSSLAQVKDALKQFGAPYVVKDDGLAAGKGVVVTESIDEALSHARDCIENGSSALIEEFLAGPEVSLFAVSDGNTVVPLIPAQDFKRVFDHDEGPNTGGMGAYAPLPWLTHGFVQEVQAKVLQPVVDEMRHRGTPFTGLLYAGLIVTAAGVKVIEFNARFGDPETQAVLALLDSSLVELLMAASTQTLHKVAPPRWKTGFAVTVVLASAGYPAAPQIGHVLTGLTKNVLHAGTKRQGEHIVSAGGRVVCAVGTGSTVEDARHVAYEVIRGVSLAGGHYRKDIAANA